MTPRIRVRELMRTYDAELMCFVREIDVCLKTGIGVLITYADSGPDMAACIDRFEKMSPGIAQIVVINWSDGKPVPDMCYRRIDGVWHAFEYTRKRFQTH
ncbi:hypothetical protein [Ruegeria lacuscaerulensis]|uniref:hypothetical protein n=1 Tax=Ruegeria lacuscaerulensis TaxID=55218 RepID=UPI00147C93F6|nr:hypothetical protein [Ruegeria lacuscaerulensis]